MNAAERLLRASNRGGFGSLLFNKERKGLSHIGYFKVEGPAEHSTKKFRTNSKIRVVMQEDNIPAPVADATGTMARPGGGRYTGPETFIDTAHDTHVTIGQVDHQKMGKMMIEEINKMIKANTFPKKKGDIVFKTHKLVLDENGQPKIPEKLANGDFVEPTSGWKMEADPSEVLNKKIEIEQRLKSTKSAVEKTKIYEEFAVWLQERAAAKRAELINRGVIFMWINRGAYFDFSTYCTQFDIIAWLLANGINPQVVPDKSSPLTQALYKFASWLKTKRETLSPSMQKRIDAFLANDAVNNAIVLNKLFRTFAPAGMFNQEYVNKNGIHRAQLIFAGLANIAKTLSNEIFERTPHVKESLNRLLDPAKYQVVKTFDKYDLIGVTHHLMHSKKIQASDTGGVQNLNDRAKNLDELRATIPQFKLNHKNTNNNLCPAVFKTAG